MKHILQSALSLFKKYFYALFVAAALVLPDIMIKRLMRPGSVTTKLAPTTSALFSLAWICLILFVCIIILPKLWGRIVFAVTTVFFTIFAFSECIYYKIFDQFFWLKSIALAGEGADYLDYVFQMVDANMVVCVVLALAFMVLALVFWREVKINKIARIITVLVPVLTLVGVHVFLQPVFEPGVMNEWDTWRKPRAVYKKFADANRCFEITGIYQYVYLNAYTAVFPAERYSDKDYQKVADFFEKKGEMPVNEYTELFKGKNVIAVMLESVDSWVIDKDVTPTLHYMMSNGINFSNYNAPMFGSGATLGSEFAFNTGYFTPLSAISAAHCNTSKFPYALANLFKEAGYATNSFHFNDPGFYNRGVMHRRFGYEKYNSFKEFGSTGLAGELDSNILKNDAIYEKMIEKQPFFDFLITYSAHLPYRNGDIKVELAKTYHPEMIDETIHPEVNNMQILATDTDAFFRQLLTRLEEDGLLDDTVIVAYADHYAYGMSHEVLSEQKKDQVIYHVPAFIYAKGIEPVRVSKPMMTVDWAPTLVNLFGLNRDGGYLGNDVLDPANEGFAYFENWSWLDSEHYYDHTKLEEQGEETDYIRKQNERVRECMEVNDIVILGDYYAKIR